MKKNGWVQENNSEYLDEKFSYYQDGIRIIVIVKLQNKNPESYYAMIVNNFVNSLEGSEDREWVNDISGNDIEILKLKCALKAKDLGWDIKEL